jgi:GWxTD domain-containing protein
VRKTPEILRGSRAFLLVLTGAVAACGGLRLGSRPQNSGGSQQPASAGSSAPGSTQGGPSRDPQPPTNIVDFNRRLGLISHGAPMPFTGTVTYFAAGSADSTHALVALTLPPSALVFRRESDQYRADYRVQLALKRGEAAMGRIEALETIRVGSVRETGSPESSIIFQQLVTVVPGTYTLSVSVTDEASAKKGTTEITLQAPTFTAGTVSRPVAYFDVTPRVARDSVPRIVTNPRAVFTFARDSTIDAYVEAYGVQPQTRLSVAVQVENTTVWTDSIEVRQTAAPLATATIRIPVARLAPGIAYLATWVPGSSDTARTPFFVSYGEPVPVTTFADMIGYLRFFASDARLRTLSAAPVQGRGTAWANFYRETDQSPETMQNEALNAYLERVRYADAQFTEGATPGWRTDRGMVWLLFGQYDVAVDPFGSSTDRSERGRTLLWEYRSLNLAVEFIRVAPFSQWRMTPASEQNVRAAAKRQLGGDIQR